MSFPKSTARVARLLAALLPVAASLTAAEPGMVLIPGGEFQRGRTFEWKDAEVEWYPTPHKDDLPAQAITLGPFYMDEAEVTNDRYAQFVKAAGHRPPYYWVHGEIPAEGGSLPVVDVSWDDAAAFCAWEGKRLPTEAEWERAARGTTPTGMYPWGDREPTEKDAHFDSEGPAPVCSAAKNGFGLCDMIGNVWEWCSDWYGRTYYSEAPARDPKGPDSGHYKVLRGGSWFDKPPLFLTVSYRSWAKPAERSPTIGFRCAKNAAQ